MEPAAKVVLGVIVDQIGVAVSSEPVELEQVVENELALLVPDEDDQVDVKQIELRSMESLGTLTGLSALLEQINRTLLGTNIFTPGLCYRGWMFWKKLSLSKIECKAVSDALLKCSDTQVAGSHRVLAYLEGNDSDDPSFILAGVILERTVVESALYELGEDLRLVVANG